MSPPFSYEEAQAQSTCPKSHSEETAEVGFKPRSVCPESALKEFCLGFPRSGAREHAARRGEGDRVNETGPPALPGPHLSAGALETQNRRSGPKAHAAPTSGSDQSTL